MPLKHLTETILIAVLAVVTALVGVLVATLPMLPQGFLPAVMLLGICIAFVLAMYPFLRKNRADNEFRLLHFAPALLVGLWLLLQILGLWMPGFLVVLHLFTWGWTFVGVAVTLVLLALFSLHVIRRRVPRVTILASMLVAFGLFAVAGERIRWDRQLSTLLWDSAWRSIAWGGAGSSSPMLSSSSSSSRVIAIIPPPPPPTTPAPPRLPHSGFGSELAIPLVLAGYCGVLHRRARWRSQV